MGICVSGSRWLVLILLFLLPFTAHGQWSAGAWPATNPAQFGGSPSITTNTSALLTNAVPALTNWGNVTSSGMYCPTGGIWFSSALRSDIWVKVALTALPSNTVSGSVVTNLCIVGGVTNGLADGSLSIVQFQRSDDPSVLTISTNASACVVLGVTNFTATLITSTLVSNIPASQSSVLATSVYLRLMAVDEVVSRQNPTNLYGSSFAWTNISAAVNYGQTSSYQVISSYYQSPTNYIASNACLRLEQAWVYDAVMSEAERWQVLWQTNGASFYPLWSSRSVSGSMQLMSNSVPVASVSANTLNQRELAAAKGRALALNRSILVTRNPSYPLLDFKPQETQTFAIKELADTNGTFDTWCGTPDETWSRVTDAAGTYWNGSNLYTLAASTSYWKQVKSYLPLPTWYDAASQDLQWKVGPPVNNGIDPTRVNGVFVPAISKLWTSGIKMGAEYCKLTNLHLPYGIIEVPLTNFGMNLAGIYFGKPEMASSNATVVLTNKVLYGSYYRYSPAKTYATAASTNEGQGLGHLVTNRWEFSDKWLWYGTGSTATYFVVNGGSYSPSSMVVTSLTQVLTNSLRIAADTKLHFATPYWNTNAFWHHTEFASNAALVTYQVLSLSNYTTVATNALGSSFASNCSTALVVVSGVTNIEITCSFTNVSRVKLEVIDLTYAGQTNAAISNNPLYNLPDQLSYVVRMPPLKTNSTTLASLVLTNELNTNSVSRVYTNWPVAAGYHEADYGWDGVKKSIDSLRWTVMYPGLYRGDGTLVSLYDLAITNKISSLADTNDLGLFVYGIVADSVSLADTNDIGQYRPVGMVGGIYSSTGPGAARVVYPNPETYYRKDVYSYTGWSGSASIGDYELCTGFTCTSYTDTWEYIEGYDEDMNPMYATNSYVYGFCTCDGYTTYSITDAASAIAFAEALRALQATIPPGPFSADTTPVYTGPGLYGSCNVSPLSGQMSFWHGTTPAEMSIDRECSVEATIPPRPASRVHLLQVSFSMLSNDVQDASDTAYTGSADPAVSNCVPLYVGGFRASDALLLQDIPTNFFSGRELYLHGADLGGYSASPLEYVNTNLLPVAVNISTNAGLYTWESDNTAYWYYVMGREDRWGEHDGPCMASVEEWTPSYSEYDVSTWISPSWGSSYVTNENLGSSMTYMIIDGGGSTNHEYHVQVYSHPASNFNYGEIPRWGNRLVRLVKKRRTWPTFAVNNTFLEGSDGTFDSDYRRYLLYIGAYYNPDVAAPFGGAHTPLIETNINWSVSGVWNSAEATAALWESALSTGKWSRVSITAELGTRSYASTNYVVKDYFLKGDGTERLWQFWGIDGSALLLKWDAGTNGFRFK